MLLETSLDRALERENEARLAADPQLAARGFFEELTRDDIGTSRYPGLVMKMENTPNHLRRAPVRFAEELAADLAALSRIDPAGGPVAGPHSFYRGGPVATYDAEANAAIAALTSVIA